jgi:hypothetical protein
MSAHEDVGTAKAEMLAAKENVAQVSSSLDALSDAMYDLVAVMQSSFFSELSSLFSAGGRTGNYLGQLGQEVAGGPTIPNQQLGVSASNQITVVMPPGSDGDDVVAALQKYMTRNGSVPILTVAP